MKKKTLLILALATLFTTVDVRAYEKGTKFDANYSGEDTLKFNDGDFYIGDSKYNDYIYYVTEQGQNKKYYAYCVDPQLKGANSLYVDRLLSAENASDETRKFEVGALAIMKEAQNQDPDSINNRDEKRKYEATSTALRMYINGVWGSKYGESHDQKAYLKSYLRELYRWLYYDTGYLKDDYKAAVGEAYNVVLRQYNTIDNERLRIIDESVLAEAQRLLSVGIKAAADYAAGTIAEVEVEHLESLDEYTENSKFVVIEFTPKNFDTENGELYYKEHTKTNKVRLMGASNSSTGGWQTIDSETNLLELLSSELDSIYLKFEVQKDESIDSESEECEYTSFDIKYEYKDPSVLNGAVLLPNRSATEKLQRFFIYTDEPIEKTFNVKNKCEDSCDPKILLPELCEPGMDNAIVVDPNDDDKVGKVTYQIREGLDENEKLNIEKCLLKNKQDVASNSVQLIDDDNAKMVSENEFCKIYCKEDYDVSLPYKISTISGRYFNIGVDVKGQKDCYSTKIDMDKFNQLVADARKTVVDAYNQWREAYEIYTFAESDGEEVVTFYTKRYHNGDCGILSESFEHSTLTYRFKGPFYTTDDEGNVQARYNYPPGSSPTETFGEIRQTQEFHYFRKPAGSYLLGECPFIFLTNSDEYEIKTYEEQLAEYKLSHPLDILRGNLEIAVEQLRMYIDQFNACGDEKILSLSKTYNKGEEMKWAITYNYDPIIKYSYDEPIGVNDPKWIREAEAVGGDVMFSEDKQILAESCIGAPEGCSAVGKEGQVELLTGGSTPSTQYLKCEEIKEDYTCDTGETRKKTDLPQNIWDCDFEGDTCVLTRRNYEITTNAYVHKTASSKATYKTPRVYFQKKNSRSEIIVSASTLENADVVDGLPVGNSTPPGRYYYTITIDKLGEYYSEKGKLGRVFSGDATSLVSYTERPNKPTDIELEVNEYACTYTVSQNKCTNPDNNQTFYDGEGVCEGLTWETCVTNYCSCPTCTMECVDDVNYCNGVQEIDPQNPINKPIIFRPITPSEINPNNKTLGFNWNVNSSNILAANKAYNTIYEIETRHNYPDMPEGNVEDVDDNYVMKVKLTPSLINYIRNYNKEQIDYGHYNNETLTCYDYLFREAFTDESSCQKAGYTWNSTKNACAMTSIFCYSSFFDELKDAGYGDNIIAPKRDEAVDKSINNFNTYSAIENYHLEYGDKILTNDYWTIYTHVTIDHNVDGLPEIGPSWK